MAAAFDADAPRARGQAIGDGTPVHLTIPTDNPWVPLRILGLGKATGEAVEAGSSDLTAARRCWIPVLFRLRGLEPPPQRAGHRCAAHRPAQRRRHGVGAE